MLGSVHWSGPLAFDHPDYSIWDTYPVDEVWRLYVDAVCAAAESGIYDVMAHPDLAKVFGAAAVRGRWATSSATSWPSASARPASAPRSRAPGCARRPVRSTRPTPGSRKLRAAGVPITLASDAHLPGDVGIGRRPLPGGGRAAGYTSLARFRGREREEVPLG